jgi:hypothetical protein
MRLNIAFVSAKNKPYAAVHLERMLRALMKKKKKKKKKK